MGVYTDRLIGQIDFALRTLSGSLPAHRPMPRPSADALGEPVEGTEGAEAGDAFLTEVQRRHAAGLMRVNHVGEVCAQALYHAQSSLTSNPLLKQHFDAAALEEGDHLAWTRERLEQLDSRPSYLNPLWYAGAFVLGGLAARAGDALSLGFVVETERQVEQHLTGHLTSLPAADVQSRAVVEQMRADEARHGAAARADGAKLLPLPVQLAMRAVAKIMTSTAYWI